MKTICSLALLFLLCSCEKTLLLSDIVQKGVASEKNPELPSYFMEESGIHQGRNIAFITDANCSVCKAEYVKLAYSINLNNYKYDSLYVFIQNCKDALELEYILGKMGTPIPSRQRYLYDSELVDSLFKYSLNKNFSLIDNNKIVYICDIQSFKYTQENGLFAILK